jgi:hypothetical protein
MLSSQEQNKVVQLLGYGGKVIQAGSVIYDKVMNDRLHQLPPDTETLTRAYLAQVAVIESQMNAAVNRLSASKLDDITLNNRELQDLRCERKKIAREIADLLDIPYVGSSGGGISVCV